MNTIRVVEIHHDLYLLKHSCNSDHVLVNNTFDSVSVNKDCIDHKNFDVWHFRLGHPSINILHDICEHFPYIKINKNYICDFCYMAKEAHLPFTDIIAVSAKPFDLIHMDIWGPLNTISTQGLKYFLTIVDDYSRNTWIYLLKIKSDSRPCMLKFIQHVQTQFESNIKIIRTDNGQEFNTPSFYDLHGIIHQTYCVETPQQNAKVERIHRHLLVVTRSLLLHSKLPPIFWSYAVCHAMYLINRLPTPTLNHKSPLEMLYGSPPTFLHLKVFGCLVYASIITQNITKLDSNARNCMSF